ncbi:UNVERIFIED_CONTAM: hypothetical protein POZ17_19610 [Ralstonia mannitolilytica]
MKKLIPLSDFVLENLNPENFGSSDVRKVISYTKFLKHPLTLEMFVLCDENGNTSDFNLLDKYCKGEKCTCENDNEYEEPCTYLKRKEKILFKGFEIDDDGEKITSLRNGYIYLHFNKDGLYSPPFNTIDDLVPYGLTLTPSALEAIGIKE